MTNAEIARAVVVASMRQAPQSSPLRLDLIERITRALDAKDRNADVARVPYYGRVS